MANRRSLKDLFVRGEEITIDDGTGDPVVVWVQKLNPVEYSACLKKADAARSRVLSLVRDKDSDDYLSAIADVLNADREVLVDILTNAERGRIGPPTQAEVASEDKWTDDNYLEGLQEDWADGMEGKYVDDPEDKEAAHVHAELEKFTKEVEAVVANRITDFKDTLESATDDEIIELAISQTLKLTGDVYWITEFYKQEVLHAIRYEDDHKVRLFENREDIDELQAETYVSLSEAVQKVMVEPTEGKGLAETPPSSD